MSRIPDFKTYIGESTWGDMLDRGTGDAIRREDLPEHDKEHWWRNIKLPNRPKYKAEELRGLDLMYDFSVDKIRKKFNYHYQPDFLINGNEG